MHLPRAQQLHLHLHRPARRPATHSWWTGFFRSIAAGQASAQYTSLTRLQVWCLQPLCLGFLHRRALAPSSCVSLLGHAAKHLPEFALPCIAALTDTGLFQKEIGMLSLQTPSGNILAWRRSAFKCRPPWDTFGCCAALLSNFCCALFFTHGSTHSVWPWKPAPHCKSLLRADVAGSMYFDIGICFLLSSSGGASAFTFALLSMVSICARCLQNLRESLALLFSMLCTATRHRLLFLMGTSGFVSSLHCRTHQYEPCAASLELMPREFGPHKLALQRTFSMVVLL